MSSPARCAGDASGARHCRGERGDEGDVLRGRDGAGPRRVPCGVGINEWSADSGKAPELADLFLFGGMEQEDHGVHVV